MVEGEYYNCFGIVYLDTDASEIETDKNVQDAFLHEDIHFVQNFYTLYGVNKAIVYMSMLARAFEFAHHNKWYLPRSDEEDMVTSFFEIIAGDSDQKACHAIENIKPENQFKELYREIPQYKLGVEADTITLLFHGDNETYNFGGEAISESVAYIFEKILFNSNDYQGHQFPYNACELVYEYYFNKKCADYPALLLAGYLSLMTKKPGITFVETMQTLKERGKFSTPAVKEVLKKVSGISDEQIKLLYERIDCLFPLNFDETSE